jgi:hypothetical protein
MQEQLTEQLVQTLQEKAGLSADQARQVTQVVIEFGQQNRPAIMQAVGDKSGINVSGILGGLMGGAPQPPQQ